MKIHRDLNTEENQDSEQGLFKAIAAIKTPEEARKFFQDLCTPAEIQAMADRWLIVDDIVMGKPYRQIYDETGVSVTTVGRVARSIMFGEGGYRLIYERVGKKAVVSKNKSRNQKTSRQ